MCTAPDVMTKDKGDVLVQLVQLALTRLTTTFSVVPTAEPLKIYPEGEDQACGQVNGVAVPSIYKNAGKDKTGVKCNMIALFSVCLCLIDNGCAFTII